MCRLDTLESMYEGVDRVGQYGQFYNEYSGIDIRKI